jgi:hypothetical protein
MASYKATDILLPGDKTTRMIDDTQLEIGDLISFPDGRVGLVHKHTNEIIPHDDREFHLEIFTLQFGPNRWFAFSRTKLNGVVLSKVDSYGKLIIPEGIDNINQGTLQ